MNAAVLIGKPKRNNIKENRTFAYGLEGSNWGLKLPSIELVQ